MRSATLKTTCGNVGICYHPAKENLYIVPIITSCPTITFKKQIIFMIERMYFSLVPSTVFRNRIADWKNSIFMIFWIYNAQNLFFQVYIIHG